MPISCLEYGSNTIPRKLPVKSTSGVHFIYPEVRVWVAVKTNYVMKKIYINPNPNIYSGMYNNGDANSIHHIFEREPTETKKYYPAVGLSRKKIYAEQPRQKYFY